jgi:hypothetical protein
MSLKYTALNIIEQRMQCFRARNSCISHADFAFCFKTNGRPHHSRIWQ